MSRNKILAHLEAIIETKSILAASRKLYVSQPSLSQYVKRLENDYGIAIFDRTSNPWKLTAEGEKLLEAQRQIEAIERECRQYFADRKGLKTGEIVIGSTEYRTVTLLNPILSVFKSRYPGITVRIEEGTTLEAAQLAESGRVDCALVITQMVPNTLDQVPIYDETVLVGLPPMHPYVAQHKPGADGVYPKIQITELKDTPFIIMKQGQVFHNYFEHLRKVSTQFAHCARNTVHPDCTCLGRERHRRGTYPFYDRARLRTQQCCFVLDRAGSSHQRSLHCLEKRPLSIVCHERVHRNCSGGLENYSRNRRVILEN